ncbi:hypothetical protein E2562_012083 [Oryza meyeriana var. granulata]|uniref:Uncharacterized protein n=1 Tax=Oryza meyeriana var. granulata TaxID=110450 RepID=A0A6G1F7G5_9ORYZ|nr:hypothetical protein E2562_012083 [Oryza meyeriana var. granulata]
MKKLRKEGSQETTVFEVLASWEIKLRMVKMLRKGKRRCQCALAPPPPPMHRATESERRRFTLPSPPMRQFTSHQEGEEMPMPMRCTRVYVLHC